MLFDVFQAKKQKETIQDVIPFAGNESTVKVQYLIEKNIPVAPKLKKKKDKVKVIKPVSYKYPFYIMEVGDSFAAPNEKAGAVSATMANVHKKTDMRFVMRKLKDGSHRVWRLK